MEPPPSRVRRCLACAPLAVVLALGVPAAAELQLERIWDLQSDGSGYPAGIPLPPRTVAVTIDDGPQAQTEPFSTFLREQGVPTSFYFVLNRIDTHPEGVGILEQVRDDGHMVANHTITHPNLTLDPAGAPEEIRVVADVLWPFTTNGVQSFRPPYAAWSAAVHAAVAPVAALDRLVGPVIHEIATADWDCLPNGFTPAECAAPYVDILVNQRPDQNGILMLHEHVNPSDPTYAFETIQAIVGGLRAAPGPPFEFVPLDAVPGLAGTLALGPPSLWSAELSDAAGWSEVSWSSSLRAGDVDRDGRDDVCGRTSAGVVCALSDGSALAPSTLWSTSFGDAAGGADAAVATTLQLGDVDGDGAADLCGRTAAGVVCELSNGVDAFVPSAWSSADFSDAAGFASDESRYRSLRLGDVDGDGRADLCGRGADGVRCALSGPAGFAPAALWSGELSDAAGFDAPEVGATLALGDLDDDGRDDLCVREPDGVSCALSDGAGFGPLASWQPIGFRDDNGFAARSRFLSLRLADVDADRLADVCIRTSTGVECASSDGTRFVDRRHVTNTTFLDLQGWDAEEHGPTLLVARLRGAPWTSICGRDDDGLVCQDAPIDPDRDGVPSATDNCAGAWNPTQADANADGKGDACSSKSWSCGLGAELALVLPVLSALARRRRRGLRHAG